jgi:hypothetical protein
MLKRDSFVATLGAVIGGACGVLLVPTTPATAQVKPTLTWRAVGQTPAGLSTVIVTLVSTNGDQIKTCIGGAGSPITCLPASSIN